MLAPASQNRCGAFLCFSVLAVEVTAASRRLAVVLGHHWKREWYLRERMAIAFPFWSLAQVATTGVAGDELVTASEFLSDERGTVPCRNQTRIRH